MDYVWGFGGIEINQESFEYVTGLVKYERELYLNEENDSGKLIKKFKGWRVYIYVDDLVICDTDSKNFVLSLIQNLNYIEKNNLNYEIRPRFNITPDAKNLVFYNMKLETDLFEINDIVKNGKAQIIPQLIFKSETLYDSISNLVYSDEVDFRVTDDGSYRVTDDGSFRITE